MIFAVLAALGLAGGLTCLGGLFCVNLVLPKIGGGGGGGGGGPGFPAFKGPAGPGFGNPKPPFGPGGGKFKF